MINILKNASRYARRSNQLKLYVSLIICLVLISANVFVQPAHIYGQSNPFSSSKTCSKLQVSAITASGADTFNPPSHAIDQNISTRWSNLGLGSWIQIDLGQDNVICGLGINWHRGDERINSFVISISKDGTTFTNVYSGKSDGASLSEQSYNFEAKTGRYVRVTVNGNTQNNWVSISELNINGYKPTTESCVSSPISTVTASSSQSGFPSSDAVDNNPNTIWSNYGVGSWIQLDLGTSKDICSVDIAWYKGNQRQNNFEISTSLDGKSYKTVLSSKSSGNSLSYENYVFADRLARYVKITVNGNNQNNYASIAEIKVQVSSNQSQSQCVDSPFQNVKTSGSQVSFPGSNAVDNNLDTRWSNNGVGSWIQLDLGTSKNLCSVNIAWYKGNERQNNFVISASNDGEKFSDILTSKSSGSTLNSEKYKVTDTNARYLRVTVNGNTQNTYASITEISIGAVNAISISSNYYIGAAGDWGSVRNDNWEKTVGLMINNKVNLSLGLGDYSYGSVGDFIPVVDALKAKGIPFKGPQGNHDTSSYAKLFGQPSMLYAFDAGQARIILLNTEDTVTSNVMFLESELKATKQPWKIVVMHKPLYTSPSTHPEEKDLGNKLQPLFDQYGVQLVLYAHNHNYERIKFPDKPTVFIQAGTGGESHYPITGNRSGGGVQYQDDKDFGFVKITINSNALSGQFISHAGKLLDSFSIIK
ncbi:MAG TPA: discoidin domain-containing protein [Nitrososphaeraceae archaeon]